MALTLLSFVVKLLTYKIWIIWKQFSQTSIPLETFEQFSTWHPQTKIWIKIFYKEVYCPRILIDHIENLQNELLHYYSTIIMICIINFTYKNAKVYFNTHSTLLPKHISNLTVSFEPYRKENRLNKLVIQMSKGRHPLKRQRPIPAFNSEGILP